MKDYNNRQFDYFFYLVVKIVAARRTDDLELTDSCLGVNIPSALLVSVRERGSSGNGIISFTDIVIYAQVAFWVLNNLL